ncbi:MAG: hypothetical protein JSW60_09010, partial [Thermoplasmatales archaeon]
LESYLLKPLPSKNRRFRTLPLPSKGSELFCTFVSGGGVDKFRIKIWDKDDGDAIVYDNNDDEYGTELGGGQIKIHEG